MAIFNRITYQKPPSWRRERDLKPKKTLANKELAQFLPKTSP